MRGGFGVAASWCARCFHAYGDHRNPVEDYKPDRDGCGYPVPRKDKPHPSEFFCKVEACQCAGFLDPVQR